MSKSKVVAKGCHVWIRDEPAVVAVVLTVAHELNCEICVADGGSQFDEMVAPEGRAISEFVQHAFALFGLAPSGGKQPEGDLDDVGPTAGIQLQNATPLHLSL